MVSDKTQGLLELTLEETVFDFDIATPAESESEPPPDYSKVMTEEDLVGKAAHISYDENLLHLAHHLNLPITRCRHIDLLSQVACPAVPPFEVNLKPRGTGVALEWVSDFQHVTISFALKTFTFWQPLGFASIPVFSSL